jgi:hypothetical protein
MTVFWDIAPCSLVELDQCLRGVYCLHYQGDDCISEMSVKFYQVTWCNIPNIMWLWNCSEYAELINYTQPVYVWREDPNSRQNTIKEIIDRATSDQDWPQVCGLCIHFDRRIILNHWYSFTAVSHPLFVWYAVYIHTEKSRWMKADIVYSLDNRLKKFCGKFWGVCFKTYKLIWLRYFDWTK